MTNEQIVKDLKRREAEVVALRESIAAEQVRLAGMEAELRALAKRVPATGPGSKVPVTERVARFVESQSEPVGAKAVAAHLSSQGVAFSEGSLSFSWRGWWR